MGALTGGGDVGGDPVSEVVLRAAIDWQVRIESGLATKADHRAFEHWRLSDPTHEAAWQRASNLLSHPLAVVLDLDARVPGQAYLAQKALLINRRRGLLRGALAVAGASSVAALVTDRVSPIGQFTADLRTGTGQRQTFALPDGSRVQLNARSAADVAFGDDVRGLRLRAGDLMATVLPDNASRPFKVQALQGTVRALESRFLCGVRGEKLEVVALERSVEIEARNGQHVRLQEGESALLEEGQIRRIEGNAANKAAWSQGMVAVEDASLGEVIDALRPYHAGLIRISPAAARLRVLGVFPLDDTGQALQTLAHVLPLNVQRYGNWIIVIDLRQA